MSLIRDQSKNIDIIAINLNFRKHLSSKYTHLIHNSIMDLIPRTIANSTLNKDNILYGRIVCDIMLS